MTQLRHVICGVVLATCAVSLASAQSTVVTAERSELVIEYDGPTQLSNEYVVMRIRIRNHSGENRVWAFDFNALRSSYVEVGRRTRFELEVDDGLDRQFELLVPVSSSSDPSWIQMTVHGYGVVNAGQMEVVENTWRSSIAISTNAASAEHPVLHEHLASDPAATGNPFGFSAALLPSDWRAYSGLSAMWLAAEEWKGASANVRRALTDWVASGGCLVLVEPGDVIADAPIRRLGLGHIVTIPETLSPEDVGSFDVAKPRPLDSAEAISWVQSLIKPIETHNGLLSLVLLGYLALAAPVNLFVLAPGKKRMRLFWTMPAIALGASALMAVVILLQDGLGGSGFRTNLVYLQPELNRELVVQEQVSRTGALLRRSFDVEESVVIESLPTRHEASEKPAELRSQGTSYGGDWFRSRSIQAQRLETVRSSRARIELVGWEAGAPLIQSSIDVPLDELFYRERSGRIWRGENVLPGRPVSLKRARESDYEAFWREVSFRTAGPAIRARTDTLRELDGAFLASADVESADVAIETLTSIDWTDGAVLYAGHIREAAHVREAGR